MGVAHVLGAVGLGLIGVAAAQGHGSPNTDAWRALPLSPPFGPHLGRAGAYGPKDCLHAYVRPADFLALTGSPPESDWGGRKRQDKINLYAARMAKRSPPATFPVPWLTFMEKERDGEIVVVNHEGRHRAAAAIQAGITRIPVSIQWSGSRDMRTVPEITRLIRGETISVTPQSWSWRKVGPPVRLEVFDLEAQGSPNRSDLTFYHGAQRWDGPPTIVAHRSGRAEHGPGIYLTTSWETARKYAKGGGAVYRVTVRGDVGWLEGARLDAAETTAWLRISRASEARPRSSRQSSVGPRAGRYPRPSW